MVDDALGELARTQAQLFDALQIQLGLLIDLCYLFDRGRSAAVFPMANVLRLLLHENPRRRGRNSPSLLSKLDLRRGVWFDSAVHVQLDEHERLIEACALVAYSFSAQQMHAVPNLFIDNPDHVRFSPFEFWWSGDAVAFSEVHGAISRERLVSTIADKDGAHVDEALPTWYWAFQDGNFLRTQGRVDHGPILPIAGLTPAFLRQIAHEVLVSLSRLDEKTLPRDYHWVCGEEIGCAPSLNGEGDPLGEPDALPVYKPTTWMQSVMAEPTEASTKKGRFLYTRLGPKKQFSELP